MQWQKLLSSFVTANALSPLICGIEMDPDSDVVMRWGITALVRLGPFIRTRDQKLESSICHFSQQLCRYLSFGSLPTEFDSDVLVERLSRSLMVHSLCLVCHLLWSL